MGQISRKFSKESIDEMMKCYEDKKDTSPQNVLFRARTENAVITIFHTGTVSFQGANPEKEAAKWPNYISETTTNKQAKKEHDYLPTSDLFTNKHIGADESGKGDYFGPLVTAAAYLDPSKIEKLQDLGIRDSKKINNSETVFRLMKEIDDLEIPYSFKINSNADYNELNDQGWNLNKVNAHSFQETINALMNKVDTSESKGIFIDEFCSPDNYKKYIEETGQSLFANTYFDTDAEDQSMAVAVASIIARYHYLVEMDKLSKIAGTELLRGSSQDVNKQIAQIIKEHEDGRDLLNKIAKVHFANTKNAEAYL